MDPNELAHHLSIKIHGSPQDDLDVKNMGREKKKRLNNILDKVK